MWKRDPCSALLPTADIQDARQSAPFPVFSISSSNASDAHSCAVCHLRFAKDLPPGLDAMNDHLVSAAFPPEVQPVQEIMQILQAATRQPDL